MTRVIGRGSAWARVLPDSHFPVSTFSMVNLVSHVVTLQSAAHLTKKKQYRLINIQGKTVVCRLVGKGGANGQESKQLKYYFHPNNRKKKIVMKTMKVRIFT